MLKFAQKPLILMTTCNIRANIFPLVYSEKITIEHQEVWISLDIFPKHSKFSLSTN